MYLRLAAAVVLSLIPSVAMAGGGAQIPEGSQLTLFALGLAGVVIGRRLAMRGPGED